MKKPILENYEKQIDVDEFVLTERGGELYLKDLNIYEKRQQEIQDCKYSFRTALDSVVEEYKDTLPNSTIRDILEEMSEFVYQEL